MSASTDNMHETVSMIPELDTFRYVSVTHMPAAGDTPDSANVAMVTTELADGGTVTVWADGTVQVSNRAGDKSFNYRAALLGTGTPALRKVGPVG